MNSGNMRYIKLFILILIVPSSCSKIQECDLDENLDLFDELWTKFDKEYSAFEIANVDWDEVYDTYRPMITENSSPEDLFAVFRDMLFELKDAHSDLRTNSNLGTITYFNEVISAHPINYIGWSDLKDKYLEDITQIDGIFSLAKIKDENIGYINIVKFDGEASDYQVIDDFISTHKNADGIIIDVRNNSGGTESLGAEIAGRFTTEKTIYRYARLKEGCERNKLGGFIDLDYDSKGPDQYLGKVILLTNRGTFSAAEDFTLMMKALPQTYHIGDNTWGGYATGPSRYPLSNGWSYRVSKKNSYNLNKEPIIGGIAPDEYVEITTEQEEQNIDAILERAIDSI